MAFLKTNYQTKNRDEKSNLFAENKDLASRVAARGSIVLINAPVCPVVEKSEEKGSQ